MDLEKCRSLTQFRLPRHENMTPCRCVYVRGRFFSETRKGVELLGLRIIFWPLTFPYSSYDVLAMSAEEISGIGVLIFWIEMSSTHRGWQGLFHYDTIKLCLCWLYAPNLACLVMTNQKYGNYSCRPLWFIEKVEGLDESGGNLKPMPMRLARI